MTPSSQLHPHDLGLPFPIIRKRRRAHAIARWMLIVAGLTALAGWSLLYLSIHILAESLLRPVLAYVFLVISSITLILGLWYLLLAQVSRIARIVDIDGLDGNASDAPAKCHNCGWPHDPPDRFCRHCGKSLIAKPLPEPLSTSPTPAAT